MCVVSRERGKRVRLHSESVGDIRDSKQKGNRAGQKIEMKRGRRKLKRKKKKKETQRKEITSLGG